MVVYVRKSDAVTASWRCVYGWGKRAIAGGFIVTSSPLLWVVLSEPLASGAGRDAASEWFVQVTDLDTWTHVASAEAEAVCAMTQ